VFYLQKKPIQTHTHAHTHTQYTQHGYKLQCCVHDVCLCWICK